MTTPITVDVGPLLDTFLLTSEGVDAVLERLKTIVLPWRKDPHYSPTRWVRLTAAGAEVGVIDPFLGGYGNPHRACLHGYGWKVIGPSGQGMGDSGLEDVDIGDLDVYDESERDELAACEEATRRFLMAKIDMFLRENFPKLTLLEE